MEHGELGLGREHRLGLLFFLWQSQDWHLGSTPLHELLVGLDGGEGGLDGMEQVEGFCARGLIGVLNPSPHLVLPPSDDGGPAPPCCEGLHGPRWHTQSLQGLVCGVGHRFFVLSAL